MAACGATSSSVGSLPPNASPGALAMAPASGARILVQYQPIGIALLITPWNYPAAMATRKIAPALAAGCTVVLKPATETPLTAFAVAQIMHDCGVPAGVVNVVTTSKASALSKAALNDPTDKKWVSQNSQFGTAIKQLQQTPLNHATQGCSEGEMPQVRQDVQNAIQAILLQGQDPKAALTKEQNIVNGVIASYNSKLG